MSEVIWVVKRYWCSFPDARCRCVKPSHVGLVICTFIVLGPFLHVTYMRLDLSYFINLIVSLQTSGVGVTLFGLVLCADGHDGALIPYCLSG